MITLKSLLVKLKTEANIWHFGSVSSSKIFWLNNQEHVATQFDLAERHGVNKSSNLHPLSQRTEIH